MVGVDEISVELFAYRLVGDGEYNVSPLRAADGQQSEVVEQRLEVVGVYHSVGGEATVDVGRSASVFHNLADDGEVGSQLSVYANEVTYFVVVRADVPVDHLLWWSAQAQESGEEIEHHVRVEHRLGQCFFREAIVVIPRFHHRDEIFHFGFQRALFFVISEHGA